MLHSILTRFPEPGLLLLSCSTILCVPRTQNINVLALHVFIWLWKPFHMIVLEENGLHKHPLLMSLHLLFICLFLSFLLV